MWTAGLVGVRRKALIFSEVNAGTKRRDTLDMHARHTYTRVSRVCLLFVLAFTARKVIDH